MEGGSHLFAVPGGIASPPVLAGMALAVAVVVLIELLSETGFAVLRVYQILFPLVTGAFLLPTLLGVQFAPFASGMLLFGFGDSEPAAHRHLCRVRERALAAPTQVYALCVGPTLAAMLAGDVVGTGLSPLAAYDFALAVNVLFVCVYALSLVLFCLAFTRQGGRRGARRLEAEHDMARGGRRRVSFRRTFWQRGPLAARQRQGRMPSRALPPARPARRRRRLPGSRSLGRALRARRPLGAEADPESLPGGGGAATAPGADSIATLIERRMDALDLASQFQPREREVVASCCAATTCWPSPASSTSPRNTARDHMKSIYRKADVHSRQELIDLFD